MPGGDHTGPRGTGPRSGRGMGYCSGYNQGVFGLGNRGAGRGWRHRFYATGIPGWAQPTPEQEAAELKAQADLLKIQLDATQKRIEELTTRAE